MEDTQTVIAGGALALLILREVFTFLKARKENGHSNGIGEKYAELMSCLEAIRRDTEHVRATQHQVLNVLSATKGSTDILLQHLQSVDWRKGR